MTARQAGAGGADLQARRMFPESVRDGCSERGCCLGLRGISSCAVLRGESVASGKKMCDCIVFHDAQAPRVVFVELKSGRLRDGQVVEKFTNALDWLSSVKSEVFCRDDCRITLLLLHRRRAPRTFYTTMRSQSFKVGGKKHSLHVRRCGEQLAALYKQMALQ